MKPDPTAQFDHAAIPPASGPRGRVRSVVAIIMVLVTVSAAAFVSARSVALPDDETPTAASFAPVDGAMTVFELSNAGGDTVYVQEHQRALGFTAITSLPDGIAAQVLTSLPEGDLAKRLFWRVTSRQMRGGLVGPQTTDVLTIDESGIQRLASFGGSIPSVFQPPLLLVPALTSVGERWTATGSALLDGALTYDYRASVEQVDDEGCAVVASQLDVLFAGTPFTSQTGSERWCPGRGVVSAQLDYDQGGGPEPVEYAQAEDAEGLVAGERRPEAPPLEDAGDPSSWQAVKLTPTKRDPFLGDMVVDGITGVPPVTGAGGLLVTVLGNGSDVVGFGVGQPADGAEADSFPLMEMWRVHPGGDPLAVAVLDDLVVVTTSTRRLVAYDLNGVRRWRVDTDDLTLRPPVRATDVDGADVVVSQDLSGQVTAMNAADGSVRWTERTRADSDLTPVVLGDVVVVADRSGDLMGLDPASGRRVWVRRQPSIDAIGVLGDRLVVARGDGAVLALDRRGDELWSSMVDVRPDRIDEVAGQPALVGGGQMIVLDPVTGRLRWSKATTIWVDGWSGGLAVHEGDRVCVVDSDGRDVRCWPVGASGSMLTAYVAASREGLWVLDSGLEVMFIGPSPEGVGS